ncbi:acyl carrier protein phosphodiesterase [Pseudoalteromonas luteoviolacea]|uniref:acyl carrier protein phosphodiesterase n=1 Tax=Pseudoalteromonas luteoviolacea TaxID=43657 RepID=UPI001B3595C1|nr:acyl carrier protein phosphodiesterase [Pseudoalteromonas luteoviolacea]MBQ4812821.1 acyl carrier protein phosphodiesterase [Pseudoalteromonas luteoviolacea]
MNYLAHLFLAQSNADSYFGNLLGDFQKGLDMSLINHSVKNGLANHILVDKFTDQHRAVRFSKSLFSNERKRFSGVALDVLYDHFLIAHWHLYTQTKFNEFKHHSYQLLQQNLPVMPVRMQYVMNNMINHDWFAHYQSLQGTAQALDNISKRIRFKNQFSGIGKEIEDNYTELEQLFLEFFPELIEHVANNALESQPGSLNNKLR